MSAAPQVGDEWGLPAAAAGAHEGAGAHGHPGWGATSMQGGEHEEEEDAKLRHPRVLGWALHTVRACSHSRL